MTTKVKAEEKPAAPAVDAKPADVEVSARSRSECVVDAPFHVGPAVNGLVCSYHAMHYLADGTRRTARL